MDSDICENLQDPTWCIHELPSLKWNVTAGAGQIATLRLVCLPAIFHVSLRGAHCMPAEQFLGK